ncbi:MAG: hypothetical protein ACFE7I_09715 [Candidatus Hodarchaeota archaeon]
MRHWYATKYYHDIRDLLKTQQEMGHRRITSTMQYLDMERAIYGEASDDEWIVKIPDSPDDAKELLRVGFEYVGDIHDKHMFRKRK